MTIKSNNKKKILMTPNPKIVFKKLSTTDYYSYSCCTIVNNAFIQKSQLCSEINMFKKLNVRLHRYFMLCNLPSRFALF